MTRLSRITGTFVVALLATSSACTFIVDTDNVQCNEPADCVALGYENSDCVDKLCVADTTFICQDVPFTAPSATETVPFSLSVFNLIGFTPYPDLTVQSCPSLDTDCDTPIETVVTGEMGQFSLELQEGFQGHIFVPPGQGNPEVVPLRAHIFPPPSNDLAVPRRGALVVATMLVLENLADTAKVALQPTSGHVFFTAIDCQGRPLEGVTVTPSVQTPETLVAYLGDSGQPDLSLIGTGTTGQGAMINIPPGFVTITGLHESQGVIFEQSVLVAAETITSVPVVPTPTL